MKRNSYFVIALWVLIAANLMGVFVVLHEQQQVSAKRQKYDSIKVPERRKYIKQVDALQVLVIKDKIIQNFENFLAGNTESMNADSIKGLRKLFAKIDQPTLSTDADSNELKEFYKGTSFKINEFGARKSSNGYFVITNVQVDVDTPQEKDTQTRMVRLRLDSHMNIVEVASYANAN